MAVKRLYQLPIEVDTTLPRSDTLQNHINRLLTIGDLMRAFDICHMTVHKWRKKYHLPTIVIRGDGKDAIRFHPREIIKWADKYDVYITYPEALQVDRSVYCPGEGELV